MSDKYIEKTFLYLLALSVFLHAALFLLIIHLPQEKKVIRQEPYMVELQDLPPSPEPPAKEEKEARRLAEERRRVARETAPREEMERERIARVPKALPSPVPQQMSPPPQKGAESDILRQFGKGEALEGEAPTKDTSRGGDFFKRKDQGVPDLAKLFPSARTMENLEEGYRKKYGGHVRGDTLFLDNSDDNVISSFSRRFQIALNERWQPVASELIRNGQLGYGLVLITIDRDGTVKEVKLVESSGNRLVDQAAINTAKTNSYVGPLPKRWPYEKLHGYYVYTAGYVVR